MFRPKILTTLRGYTLPAFGSDLAAGIVVGIVAIPLAIAFAIASGVTPDKGIVTAIVAGLVVSLLGGSRVQIGGPTGAFIVIVYAIVARYGVDGLIAATALAGVFLIVMGVARLGAVIKFIPHPVIVGFTSGIALIIFSSQVKDLLGLRLDAVPADFIDKWRVYSGHLGGWSPEAVAVSLGTILVVALWPRVSRRIPGSLVAIVLASAAARLMDLPVETIGSRFGDLPSTLPMPRLPHLDWATAQELVQPAFTIALLCAIESLLSAVIADGLIGGRHRSNTELIAQGVANIASASFGGIPATGAIARTVTNIKNGGRTPVAGVVHALTVLVAVVCFGRWIKLIPLSCLAGILAVVCYHMSEWRSFRYLLKGPRSDVAVLLVTFGLTVFVDLTVAIEVGMVLAAFTFMRRMAEVTEVSVIARELTDHPEAAVRSTQLPPGVEVYRINGPFFFGVSHKFEEADRITASKPRIRILQMNRVPVMDATGLHALKAFAAKCRHNKITLYLTGTPEQPLKLMRRSGLYDEIGPGAFFDTLEQALERSA